MLFSQNHPRKNIQKFGILFYYFHPDIFCKIFKTLVPTGSGHPALYVEATSRVLWELVKNVFSLILEAAASEPSNHNRVVFEEMFDSVYMANDSILDLISTAIIIVKI